MTTLSLIQAAATRLSGHARLTPLLNAPLLDATAKRRILVKAECLQLTGSFKFRGAWSAVSALPADRRAKGVLAFSSGNHAQGIALAAQRHGIPSVILMPSDAPAVKIDNTRSYGAEVILYDRTTESRDALGAALTAERGLHLIRPYDDPQVIAGQGTIGVEIAAQAADLNITEAAVIACCGGGGLATGIALALEPHAGFRVQTAEPAGFDDMARSLATGTHQSNATATGSICDAILTPTPGTLTLPVLARLAGAGLTVTDDQALHAMALAFTHLRIVLEPGGAVALAAALFNPDLPDTVIVTASGGNVDPATFQTALTRFAA
ncbi:threonine ammonia-lyase [Gemmobacter aquarius]|uniref:Threonine ammonia-lyase n=1 Tax=Paragemmobacter aquarius TaxID=2169400 RepID=A0A2S0UN46_9RHOB|nr:threonine/serine dehydratase [Gemmobacter aquarius]AWB49227.1 threonine ammonia-lyase [Gemmobacter aquarius]